MNVLFVIIDSARFDHFGLYGYARPTTPFLLSCARDLMVYDNANTPAAWTRPAMASIFTALYPQQYSFFEDRYPSEATPILSDILRREGYRVMLLSNNPYMSPDTGFDRGADRFYYVRPGEAHRVLDKDVVLRHIPRLIKQRLNRTTAYKVVPDMLNDQAVKIIKRAAAGQRPFFLYIHHDAHHPYLSERSHLRRFLDEGFSEDEIRLVERVQRSGNMAWFCRNSLEPEKKQRYYTVLRAMHDASICRNDELLRTLFGALKSSGLFDDTLIIIAADHGEYLGERDLVSHGLYLYEESVRVPLVVKYPRAADLSGRSGRLISTIDLMPTILDLAGHDLRSYSDAAQGISMLSDDEHEFVVSQRRNFAKGIDSWLERYPDHSLDRYDYGDLISFKTRHTKFVWSSKRKHALFDLAADPGETRNLYASEHPESQAYLGRYEAWMDAIPKVTVEATREFDEKTKHHLRGLGYIE
jgi:arylsulfatase A-like enzyme